MAGILRHAPLSRRTALRGTVAGAGVAVGLPLLEAMTGRPARAQAPAGRFIGFFKPNGMSAFRADPFGNPAADTFTPRTTGASYQPTGLLRGFVDRGLRQDFTVVTGVDVRLDLIFTTHNGEQRLSHDAGTILLAPFPYIRLGTDMYQITAGGRSLDQHIADRVGAGTRFRSLEFGVYLNAVLSPTATLMSFSAARQPNPPEPRPDRMWSRLFSGGVSGPAADPQALDRIRRQRQSVVDGVRENLAHLRTRVGAADARRIDDHLTAVRELERRVTEVTPAIACHAPPAVAPLPDAPKNVAALTRLQIDLLVMALACDLTRAATFMLGGGGSDIVVPDCGTSEPHHARSHDGPGSIPLTDLIDRWQIDQVAYLVESLKRTQEPGGSLLDGTVVLAGSDCAGGWNHNSGGWTLYGESRPKGSAQDWAFLLAGGPRYFRHGTHVRYKGGQVYHDQILRAVYEAVTGVEGDASAAWLDPRYAGPVAPGLRGDRAASMW